MYKKIALAVATFALFASPIIVSAQTTTDASTPGLLGALEALVQQLEQELQQLIASHSFTSTQNPAVAATSSNSFANLCAAYTHLTKGNTDTTTGGQVSQLQAFLGISPTTGYYGAQTAIGYQNKCGNLGNAQPTSIVGMSEYTDSSFGFSFWYPSSWQVSIATRSQYSGEGTVEKTLTISNSQGEVILDEVNDPNGAITVGNPAKTGENESYYFNAGAGIWTYETEQTSGGYLQSKPADISSNTMGGLHMFTGGGTFAQNIAVPLSVANFVVAEATGGDATEPLMATIVATNPNVATPISTAQQIATIQAEASAYGVNPPGASNNSVNFIVSQTSGSAPLSVTFSANPVPSGSSVNFGDDTSELTDDLFGNGTSNSRGYCGAGPDFFCSILHTYTAAGTYTATLTNSSGIVIGTATVTVTGSSTSGLWASPTSGKAPLTVTFLAPPSAGGDYVGFGDGTNSCTNSAAEDCGGDVGYTIPFTHTYKSPGTYTVTVGRDLPSMQIGTATITVTQ